MGRCRMVLTGFLWTLSLGAAQTDPGRVDPSFVAQGLTGGGVKIVVQTDNKILVHLHPFAGQTNVYLKRLTPDGAEDSTFNPPTFFWQGYFSPITAIGLHNDGILVGGNFTNINGSAVRHIARLNFDGSLDPGFNRELHLT